MKNLTEIKVKNVVINDLVCTPNTVILANQRISERNGEITTSVNYIEVCQIDKPDSMVIVKELLKYFASDMRRVYHFNEKYNDIALKERALFDKFLKSNTIYRTNSEGKIASALVSEVPLNQTALKLTMNNAIVTCSKENLKATIHKHSKAILEQCTKISQIIKGVSDIDKEMAEVELAKTNAKVAQGAETDPKSDPKSEIEPPKKRGRKPANQSHALVAQPQAV